MRGIDATFDGVSFEGDRNPRRGLQEIIPAAAALAVAGAIARVGPAYAPRGRSGYRQSPIGPIGHGFDSGAGGGRRREALRRNCHRPEFSRGDEADRAGPKPLAAGEPRRGSRPSRRAFSAAEPRRLSARPSAGVAQAETVPLPPTRDVSRSRRERAVAAASASRVRTPRDAGRAGAPFGAAERRDRAPRRPGRQPQFPSETVRAGAAARARRSVEARRRIGSRRRIPSCRPRPGSPSPVRRRKAEAPAGRCSAGFRRHSARPLRARVTTDIPPSMTSPRAPSTCPTEPGSKPIRAWAIGWTIPVT